MSAFIALERVREINGRTNWYAIEELRDAARDLADSLEARVPEEPLDGDENAEADYMNADEAWTEAADIHTLLVEAIEYLEAIHSRINEFDPEV